MTAPYPSHLSRTPVGSSESAGVASFGTELNDMLDGAFTSPKIRRLAAVLTIPWPHALGLCGLLWRFAAKHAPTGEVGRHEDEDIATVLEWPGDTAELVDGLVTCRLLDRVDPPARLLVHDWPDHAPRYVGATLRRRGLDWSNAYDEHPRTVFASTATDAATDAPTASDADTATDTGSGQEPARRRPTASEGPPDVGKAVAGRQTAVRPSSSHSGPSTGTSASGTSNAVGRKDRPSGPNRRSGARTAGLPIPADRVASIWAGWVPGRKTGKARALGSIVASARSLVEAGEADDVAEALDQIEAGVTRDAARYRKELATSQTELKYVPLGVTYFAQERWRDDDDEPIDTEQEAADAIRDEIAKYRRTDVG